MKVDAALPGTLSPVQSRVADYLQLVRPRLALLVLATVGAGWLLAGGEPDGSALAHALVGTALLCAGASALNQLLERHSDARMPRTANRPLPAGRLRDVEVLAPEGLLSAGGLAYLLALRQPLAAGLGALALGCYVGFSTPLKRRTPLSTLIGAVPGAVPPLLGWAAARGSVDPVALSLFLIVFLWQLPHFLAIAWIYRGQYAHAGLRVLPVVDRGGVRTGRAMMRATLVLVLANLLPTALGLGGWLSGVGALALSVGFLRRALAFAHTRTDQAARQVFRSSLVYLPVLLLVFVVDALLADGR
jgi:protoheme IX farnesyltransferase